MKSPFGAQGHSGAFEGAPPPKGTGALPYIGNAPSDAPTDREKGHGKIEENSQLIEPSRVDPLAKPGVIRIALSERASRALSETGQECFAIIGRGSYPTDPARMVIYCQPVPLEVAIAACDVLTGKATARRVKPPKAAAPASPAITPDRQSAAPQGSTGTALPSRNLLQGGKRGRATLRGYLQANGTIQARIQSERERMSPTLASTRPGGVACSGAAHSQDDLRGGFGPATSPKRTGPALALHAARPAARAKAETVPTPYQPTRNRRGMSCARFRTAQGGYYCRMKPLNSRQEKFAQLVASDVPATPAYIEAGYKVSTKVAGTNGPRMLVFAGVAARIKELRARESEKSEYKRADMVRFLVAILQTPVGDIDANSPLAQEITTDTIGEATIRKRVKMMGKIEAARLLVDIMGWKEPEQVVVETGPKTLDAVKERAERVASALDLQAHLRSKAAATTTGNGHPSGNGNGHAPAEVGSLSRWKLA